MPRREPSRHITSINLNTRLGSHLGLDIPNAIEDTATAALRELRSEPVNHKDEIAPFPSEQIFDPGHVSLAEPVWLAMAVQRLVVEVAGDAVFHPGLNDGQQGWMHCG